VFKNNFKKFESLYNFFFRGYVQCFELSYCGKTYRVLRGIVFQKELYNGIPNVNVWRVLGKPLQGVQTIHRSTPS
jgi:hypothetical protein